MSSDGCRVVQCSECTVVQTSRSTPGRTYTVILPQYGPDYQAERVSSYIVLSVVIQCNVYSVMCLCEIRYDVSNEAVSIQMFNVQSR